MTPRPESRQPIPEHAKRVFEGQLFEIYQWDQELFDGSMAVFEKARRKHDAACIIPVLPDGRLVITYDEQPARVPLITFPGGRMDDGETPEQAVLRELTEETGYHTTELEYWYGFQPSTKVDYAVYVFIGRNCENGQEVHFDAGERITTKIVTLDEVIELTQQDNFQNKEMAPIFLKAKYDPDARKELEKKLFA